MMHELIAKVIEKQRQVTTAVTGILGALVALGVIQVKSETAILSVAGIIFAFLGGSAYVQGKHVEAAALAAKSGSAMNPSGGQVG